MSEDSCPVCKEMLLEINDILSSDIAKIGDISWTAINAVYPSLGIMFVVSSLNHFMDVRRGLGVVNHYEAKDGPCIRRAYSRADAETAYKLYSVQLPTQYRGLD